MDQPLPLHLQQVPPQGEGKRTRKRAASNKREKPVKVCKTQEHADCQEAPQVPEIPASQPRRTRKAKQPAEPATGKKAAKPKKAVKPTKAVNPKQAAQKEVKEQDEGEQEESASRKPSPRALQRAKDLFTASFPNEPIWHHANQLYQGCFDSVSPENLVKSDNWELSIYWKTGRIGLLAHKKRHIVSFSSGYTIGMGLALKATNMYVHILV